MTFAGVGMTSISAEWVRMEKGKAAALSDGYHVFHYEHHHMIEFYVNLEWAIRQMTLPELVVQL